MRNILRILVFGDPANDSNLITNILDPSKFPVQQLRITAISDFQFTLKRFVPDVILAFCGAENSNGHKAFELLQESGHQSIFICISPPEFEQQALTLLRSGAADYLLSDRLLRLPDVILKALDNSALNSPDKNFAVLQEIPYAIAILMGKQHIFTFVNNFFQQKIAESHVLNKNLQEVYAHTDLAFLNEKADSVYNTGISYVVKEMTSADFNGAYFNFALQALRDKNGTIEGLLLSGQEVTEQVQYRKKKNRLAMKLRNCWMT